MVHKMKRDISQKKKIKLNEMILKHVSVTYTCWKHGKKQNNFHNFEKK